LRKEIEKRKEESLRRRKRERKKVSRAYSSDTMLTYVFPLP